MSLTQTEINEAQAILANANLTKTQQVQNFYTYLLNKGQDYGRLGLAVTNNNTWQGQIANGFLKSGASDNVGEFEVESTEWINLNHSLALAHIDAYDFNSGGVPTRQQIQDYHNVEYINAGLNEDDWFVNKLLNDSVDPDVLWDDYMQNTSLTDLIEDAWSVAEGGAKLLYGPIYIKEAYTGTAAEFAAEEAFAKNFLNALLELDDIGRADLLLESTDLALKQLNDFLDSASDEFIQLLKDYGWALNHVIDNTIDAIPSWLNGASFLFRHGIPAMHDPLIIDLDGDGVGTDTYNPNGGIGSNGLFQGDVYFDLDNDGFAEETTWVNGHDGFLVHDINNNGRVDNITELFGTGAVNGFDALAAHDLNEDGVIDNQDLIWADLEIWQDINADAITQDGELFSLDHFDITSIDVSNYIENYAGAVTHTSVAQTNSGSLEVANVVFGFSNANTTYSQDYNFDIRAAFLPTIRGYHELPSLHVALSLDNDETDPNSLMSLITSVAGYSMTEVYENWDSVVSTIEQAMFRWAGVDAIAMDSRGEFLEDARVLEFMEVYFGRNFLDPNINSTDPGEVQARTIHELWEENLLARFVSGIVMQGDAGRLFEDSGYDYAADAVFSTDVSLTSIDELETAATQLTTTEEKNDFWKGVAATFSYYNAGTSDSYAYANGNNSLVNYLDNAIQNSDASLSWSSVTYDFENPEGNTITGTNAADSYLVDAQYQGSFEADTIIGLEGADILHGGDGGDTLYGHSEDGVGDDGAVDELYGGDGDDTLIGGDGNDILHGGSGNDYMVGGNGNDELYSQGASQQNLLEGGVGDDRYTISINSGDNYINDESGIDTVYLYGMGHATNFSMSRLGNLNLKIESYSRASIVLVNQLQDPSINDGVEFIEYYNTSTQTVDTINILDYINNYSGGLRAYGSENNDIIDGVLIGNLRDIVYAGAGDDVISGDAGDDEIYGEDGNDHLSGGVGVDLVEGGNGNDIIYGNNGDDVLSGNEGNDIIYGGEGNNKIYGNDGNDIIYGSSGNDELSDGLGDDVIYTGGGNDIIQAGRGFDTLVLPENVTLSDLTYYQDYEADSNGKAATFIINGGDKITILGQFNAPIGYWWDGQWVVPDTSIEMIEFADGTTLDPFSLSYNALGTSGNDYMLAASYGASNNVGISMFGHGGNDLLRGRSGDDVLYGGEGNDTLEGGGGNDTYIVESGIDTIRYDTEGVDVLDFGAYYTPSDLSFNITGQHINIEISMLDGNKIRINEAYKSYNKMIDFYRFDGVDYDIFDPIFTYNSIGDGELYGTEGDNTLIGGDGDDRIQARGGDDILDGGAGNDHLFGYAGDDIFIYTSGLDTFEEAGAGIGTIKFQPNISVYDLSIHDTSVRDTTIILDAGLNEINLKNNRHSIKANYQFENLEFDNGMVLDFRYYNNWVWGNTNNETLLSDNGGFHTILADAGNDIIYGGINNDQLDGGSGNDKIYSSSGNDILYGGAGVDTVIFSGLFSDYTLADNTSYFNVSDNVGADGSNNVYGIEFLEFADGTYNIASSSFDMFNIVLGANASETLSGTLAGDIIHGEGGNDLIYGDDGDDTLHGGIGNDDLRGQGGIDSLYGDDGDDFLLGTFGDSLYGGADNDSIRAEGGTGTYDGGSGQDVVWWRDYQHTGNIGMTVDILSGTVTDGDNNVAIISNVEDITGSVYADILVGDDNSNQIRGGSNRFGLTDGNDTLYGYGGNDYLYGDSGDDILYGGDGNDYLYGKNDNDALYGENGDDRLRGELGNDILYGGAGTDYLYGDDGQDVLIGGSGLDFLYGGTSDGDVDTFSFSVDEDSNDRINQFEYGTDVINITDLLSGYVHGTSDISDFVQIIHTGSRFDLRVDADGGADNFAATARVLTDIDNSLTAEDLLNNGTLVANQTLV